MLKGSHSASQPPDMPLQLQIDAVMVSCSCFAPTPSMAAMIVNRFKMRTDVLTYNLSGMGCSSSLVCVDLAKHLLKVRCPAGAGHAAHVAAYMPAPSCR